MLLIFYCTYTFATKLITTSSVTLQINYTIKKILSLSILALVLSFATQAQFVVRVRLAAPEVRYRPACPSPKHVWVGGNYNWGGASTPIQMVIGLYHQLIVEHGLKAIVKTKEEVGYGYQAIGHVFNE